MLDAGLPLVAFLQLVRVYGQALAHIADAEVKLFHLYVHEPMIRDGAPVLDIAEELSDLASELLPLAGPIMDAVHQRLLQHFLEQDVVGHLELVADDAALGRVRVAIAFADLAGYTRLTEEVGEEEALEVVERFVELVAETLPDDARVIKTIGDEVMVVGTDASALADWAVGFQRCDRAPAAADRHPRRQRRSTATATTTAAPSTSRRGSARGRPAARSWSRARSSEAAGRHLAFQPIGEVKLKGFDEATELFLASARDRGSLVLFSGGRDSTCLLDLTVRPPAPVRAARQLRPAPPEADADEAHCARGLRAARRAAARAPRGRAARQRPGLGAGGPLRRGRRSLRARRRSPSATPPPTRPRPSSTGWSPRPGRRALLGMPERSGRIVRPLLGHDARGDRGVLRGARAAVARGRHERDVRARADPRDPGRCIRPPRRTSLRTLALLRDEAEVLDLAVDAALRRRPHHAPARARAARAPAAGGRRRRSRAHADAILALARKGGTASLDLPGGLRADVRVRAGDDRAAVARTAGARAGVLSVPGETRSATACVDVRASLADGHLARASRRPSRCARGGPGDRMRPLGLGGTKSLQDLFTDRKVPRARRAQLPVVLSDGEIAWVPGVATGERFRARRDGAAGAAGLAPRLAAPMSEEIGEILVQADDLQHRIRAMAEDIARDYEGKDLLLIGVLKGAFLFLADLMRHLDVGCEVDFMAVASYGSSTESSGVVRILKDLDAPLEGRNVLIVEDIVDSGLTLQYLLRTLAGAQAGLARGVRAADQAQPKDRGPAGPIHRFRDPRQVRHRLRTGLRRALPEPSLRRRAGPHRRLTFVAALTGLAMAPDPFCLPVR